MARCTHWCLAGVWLVRCIYQDQTTHKPSRGTTPEYQSDEEGTVHGNQGNLIEDRRGSNQLLSITGSGTLEPDIYSVRHQATESSRVTGFQVAHRLEILNQSMNQDSATEDNQGLDPMQMDNQMQASNPGSLQNYDQLSASHLGRAVSGPSGDQHREVALWSGDTEQPCLHPSESSPVPHLCRIQV